MKQSLKALVLSGALLAMTPDSTTMSTNQHYQQKDVQTTGQCDRHGDRWYNPPGTVSERTRFYAPLIDATEAHWDVPDNLLGGLLLSESDLKPFAVSPTGAAGLAQFTARTARSLGAKTFSMPGNKFNHSSYGPQTQDSVDKYKTFPSRLARRDERFDPTKAIPMAAQYLSRRLHRARRSTPDQYQTIEKAVSGYKGVPDDHPRRNEFLQTLSERRERYASITDTLSSTDYIATRDSFSRSLESETQNSLKGGL